MTGLKALLCYILRGLKALLWYILCPHCIWQNSHISKDKNGLRFTILTEWKARSWRCKAFMVEFDWYIIIQCTKNQGTQQPICEEMTKIRDIKVMQQNTNPTARHWPSAEKEQQRLPSTIAIVTGSDKSGICHTRTYLKQNEREKNTL